jgi:hypothetical protein
MDRCFSLQGVGVKDALFFQVLIVRVVLFVPSGTRIAKESASATTRTEDVELSQTESDDIEPSQGV